MLTYNPRLAVSNVGYPKAQFLGPLLFIIYLNDICSVLELLYTIMYADDTSVIMSGNDLESPNSIGEFGIMFTEHMA